MKYIFLIINGALLTYIWENVVEWISSPTSDFFSFSRYSVLTEVTAHAINSPFCAGGYVFLILIKQHEHSGSQILTAGLSVSTCRTMNPLLNIIDIMMFYSVYMPSFS